MGSAGAVALRIRATRALTGVTTKKYTAAATSRNAINALMKSPKEEVDMSNYVMWISIFAATISLGICFCVTTIMVQQKSDRSQVVER